MIEKKAFKKLVKKTIKKFNNQCSVCNQHIDSGEVSFANMRGIKAIWSKTALNLYVPMDITFSIPYTQVENCYEHDGGLEINIMPRRIVSIRGIQ